MSTDSQEIKQLFQVADDNRGTTRFVDPGQKRDSGNASCDLGSRAC